MDNNIQNYRQPMVTATGINLGFIFAFTSAWVTNLPQYTDWSDYLIGAGLFVSIFLQISVLYRMLDNSILEEAKVSHYRMTLKMFVFGLSFTYLGLLFSAVQIFFTPIV